MIPPSKVKRLGYARYPINVKSSPLGIGETSSLRDIGYNTEFERRSSCLQADDRV